MTIEKLKHIFTSLDIPYSIQTHNAVNIQCPFCDDKGYHCGVFKEGNFNCWRCHSTGFLFTLLQEIIEISIVQYNDLIREDLYLEGSALTKIEQLINSEVSIDMNEIKSCVWPPKGSVPISKLKKDLQVQTFLKQRRYDIDFCVLKNVYIGIIGRYIGRFIIPILYNNKVVAFQARSMASTKSPRYLTEGNPTNYLYNYANLDSTKPIIITEGIFDCWRVRENGTCTFGSALSDSQLNLLLSLNPCKIILAWDMGEDGSDMYWHGKKIVQVLYDLFGVDRVGYVLLPSGADPDSLDEMELWKLIQKAK